MMASAAGPPSSFGADLTSAGYTSAGSDLNGYPATQACDNNSGTGWLTSSLAAMADHWWRQDFGAGNAKAIRKLTLRNSAHGGVGSDNWYDTCKLQYSDNGSAWSDALGWYSSSATLTKTQNSATVDSYVFQNHGAHRYWRVVGLSGIGLHEDGGYLGGLGEIEMMEAA